jgi:DNA-binding NtrC family response regulator
MADLLIGSGYTITVTTSASETIYSVLKKTAQVVLIGSSFDDLTTIELIHLVKQCNRDITIILVSDEIPLPQIRKMRQEGLFYHAFRPLCKDDREELRLAVKCAFDTIAGNSSQNLSG